MKVVFLAGPRSGEEIEVDRELVLGRQDADIELEDSAASRRHAVLRPRDEGVEIEDLGSTNGTFVNGQRVSSRRPLHPGDVATIGGTTFEVAEDWRAAETQTVSLASTATTGPAPIEEERKPTERLPTDAPPRRGAWDVPLPWGVAAGALLALVLVALVVALSDEPPRSELVVAADERCREAEGEVSDLRLAPGPAEGVQRASARLLRTRRALLGRLEEVAADDRLGPRFATFLKRFAATNDQLARLTDLSSSAPDQALRSSLSRVRAAAAIESRAAEAAGLKTCGGLPI